MGLRDNIKFTVSLWSSFYKCRTVYFLPKRGIKIKGFIVHRDWVHTSTLLRTAPVKPLMGTHLK